MGTFLDLSIVMKTTLTWQTCHGLTLSFYSSRGMYIKLLRIVRQFGTLFSICVSLTSMSHHCVVCWMENLQLNSCKKSIKWIYCDPIILYGVADSKQNNKYLILDRALNEVILQHCILIFTYNWHVCFNRN